MKHDPKAVMKLVESTKQKVDNFFEDFIRLKAPHVLRQEAVVSLLFANSNPPADFYESKPYYRSRQFLKDVQHIVLDAWQDILAVATALPAKIPHPDPWYGDYVIFSMETAFKTEVYAYSVLKSVRGLPVIDLYAPADPTITRCLMSDENIYPFHRLFRFMLHPN